MWFFRLIRWPNLIIIILTQVLAKYAVILPFINGYSLSCSTSDLNFLLLLVTTVLIAAAGYIINDYYDQPIDTINRPETMIYGRYIKANNGIQLYVMLNLFAMITGFYLAYRVESLRLGFTFPLTAGMLWMYSARYKCSPLAGNMIIAFLSALVVLMVWLFGYFELMIIGCDAHQFALPINTVIWFYAAFAFLVTLVREIIKDIEDIAGDQAQGCQTIPIVAGIKTAKYIILIITIITMLLLAFGQFLLIRQNLMMIFGYYCIPVQLLLINLLVQTMKSHEQADFRFLGNMTKIIMVAGILGMQLFCLAL